MSDKDDSAISLQEKPTDEQPQLVEERSEARSNDSLNEDGNDSYNSAESESGIDKTSTTAEINDTNDSIVQALEELILMEKESKEVAENSADEFETSDDNTLELSASLMINTIVDLPTIVEELEVLTVEDELVENCNENEDEKVKVIKRKISVELSSEEEEGEEEEKEEEEEEDLTLKQTVPAKIEKRRDATSVVECEPGFVEILDIDVIIAPKVSEPIQQPSAEDCNEIVEPPATDLNGSSVAAKIEKRRNALCDEDNITVKEDIVDHEIKVEEMPPIVVSTPDPDDKEDNGSEDGARAPEPSVEAVVDNKDQEASHCNSFERVTGVVRFYSENKGFGFIKVDGNNDDVFVHVKDIMRKNPKHSAASLSEGEHVEFVIKRYASEVSGINGKPVLGSPHLAFKPNEFEGNQWSRWPTFRNIRNHYARDRTPHNQPNNAGLIDPLILEMQNRNGGSQQNNEDRRPPRKTNKKKQRRDRPSPVPSNPNQPN